MNSLQKPLPENRFARLVTKIATGKPVYRYLLTPLGPLFFFGLVAGLVRAAMEVDAWLAFDKIIRSPWNLWLSRPVMLGGLFLMAWSASLFFKARGTPVPINPPKRLVTTGPYAWSRNPMMLGLFLVLFGLGIRLSSWSLLFFFLPLFILVLRTMLKKVEEPALEERFQDEYRQYWQATAMFFPWPRSAKRKGIEE